MLEIDESLYKLLHQSISAFKQLLIARGCQVFSIDKPASAVTQSQRLQLVALLFRNQSICASAYLLQ